MDSMDALIGKVMTYAQKLVDADRTSLFLIDHKSGELYARIFDMGDADAAGPKTLNAQEIRFPIGTGIAGQVAVTGKVLSSYSHHAHFQRYLSVLTVETYNFKPTSSL